ncbi:surface-adhesin E family protein [Burkholderia cepacia]|uniref:surface-adhesin E family protein n=1 Tax=Burkholderia cepacia TaxID=292 RepID=UPI00265259FB|nr:surface-adhesin E family protein [Burkholderia cepacia]MDN7911925.1 hypothetical protein [Burkholderia cepacia]
MSKALRVIPLACLMSAAMASNWTAIGQSKLERIEMDQGSVLRSGMQVKVWVREVFFSDRTSPSGRAFDTLMYRLAIDCSQMTSAASTVMWSEKGNVVESGVGTDRFDIVPDSVPEFVARTVCPSK